MPAWENSGFSVDASVRITAPRPRRDSSDARRAARDRHPQAPTAAGRKGTTKPPGRRTQQQVIPAAEQWALGVEAVRDQGREAVDRGLGIAIELEPFKLSLVNSIDTMLAFLDQVGQPETVRANCEISHLHLVGTPPAEVARLAGRIEHVHVSDCDGKVHGDLPPGRGVTPIADYLAAIRDTGYDGVVSIELEFAPEPERIVERVAEATAATAGIMASLGCRLPSRP